MSKIVLTYDDGPDTRWTLPLLEVLERHNVRATFFMIGRFVATRAEIAMAVASAGHAIGNHTFNHPDLTRLFTDTQIDDELEQCERALTHVVGAHSNLFRPPYGWSNPKVENVALLRGLKMVKWDADGEDWILPKSAKDVERLIASKVHTDSIVLLHDGYHEEIGADRSASVEATELLISRYKREGFEFVQCW